ncbi:MAG: tRNA pseudouridine(38-40) synthase TruA [Bacteroidota bacterium]|nr:tRNA pseudouridine(38-40) synthase TruA [Bacteroidota bacterium]
MYRYFLEVAYNGTAYSGFQVQDNAPTIQAEVEKALAILLKQKVELTGSSRTDAGVHALQNFFHFDISLPKEAISLYNLNAILPQDIVALNLYKMDGEAHCRFHATARAYKYYIYQTKNPFLNNRAWFYPYHLNMELLKKAAQVLMEYSDFTTFSKRNTQVKTYICKLFISQWEQEKDCWVYHVKGNRFLRGMVRGMVGTMLNVGREKITLDEFRAIIEAKDCTKANFTTPAHGLFLQSVEYPAGLLGEK